MTDVETIQTTEVLLQASIQGDESDPDHDASEALEASTRLPMVPRKGDELSVWIGGDSWWGNHEEFLTVTNVVLSTFEPERIVVGVSTDGHGIGALRRIFLAVENSERP